MAGTSGVKMQYKKVGLPNRRYRLHYNSNKRYLFHDGVLANQKLADVLSLRNFLKTASPIKFPALLLDPRTWVFN